MVKKSFTLIELLVVAAVIMILMGMLLGGVNMVRKRAKRTQAEAQINAIVTAIKSYESQYGLLPWADGNCLSGDDGTINDAEWDDILTASTDNSKAYDILVQILTQVDLTGTAIDAAARNKASDGNTRKIRFIDAPSRLADTSYLDPWGNRYVICLDLDYNNQVTVGSDTLNGTVFVYSFGPDGNDDEGITGANEKDDISSWK